MYGFWLSLWYRQAFFFFIIYSTIFNRINLSQIYIQYFSRFRDIIIVTAD